MTELALVLDSPASRRRCHSPREEYFTWVRQVFDGSPASVRSRRYFYDRFVRHWPDLEDWFAEPLLVRLDLHDRDCWQSGKRKGPSHEAGTYLAYLSLTHRMPMDVDWLFSRNFDSMFRPQVAVGASPAPPPRPCSTTNSARTPWTGSRATSSRPNSNSATACACPPRVPASVTSTYAA
jgi:hypothetical protein